MAFRLAAGVIAVALVAGCRSAPARWSSSTAPDSDPDRWERALCSAGAVPETLDAAALSHARQEDLRAASSGLSSPGAFEALLGERTAFEARCTAWRAPMAIADGAALRTTAERSRTLRTWAAARDRLGAGSGEREDGAAPRGGAQDDAAARPADGAPGE